MLEMAERNESVEPFTRQNAHAPINITEPAGRSYFSPIRCIVRLIFRFRSRGRPSRLSKRRSDRYDTRLGNANWPYLERFGFMNDDVRGANRCARVARRCIMARPTASYSHGAIHSFGPTILTYRYVLREPPTAGSNWSGADIAARKHRGFGCD